MILTLNDVLLLVLGIASVVWSIALVTWVVYLDSSQRTEAAQAMDDAFHTVLGELGEQRRLERMSSTPTAAE